MAIWWATDLPNWLVAVGTIGAFGTGGVLLMRELHRDRERDELMQRLQASSVAAWPIRSENKTGPLSTIAAKLVLNNVSSEPVYRIQIEYRKSSSELLAADEIDILPPGRYERDLPDALQEVWIKSAEGWIKRGPNTGEPTSTPQYQPWSFVVVLTFFDAGGRSWCREADGSLKRQ